VETLGLLIINSKVGSRAIPFVSEIVVASTFFKDCKVHLKKNPKKNLRKISNLKI
jgi:hypothetical protein